ncbi:hypothetical protein SNEBB_003530 [Seison nebaliae]|nr:hypothetical protein SNEBB_003530 [Seison nebaliae]
MTIIDLEKPEYGPEAWRRFTNRNKPKIPHTKHAESRKYKIDQFAQAADFTAKEILREIDATKELSQMTKDIIKHQKNQLKFQVMYDVRELTRLRRMNELFEKEIQHYVEYLKKVYEEVERITYFVPQLFEILHLGDLSTEWRETFFHELPDLLKEYLKELEEVGRLNRKRIYRINKLVREINEGILDKSEEIDQEMTEQIKNLEHSQVYLGNLRNKLNIAISNWGRRLQRLLESSDIEMKRLRMQHDEMVSSLELLKKEQNILKDACETLVENIKTHQKEYEDAVNLVNRSKFDGTLIYARNEGLITNVGRLGRSIKCLKAQLAKGETRMNQLESASFRTKEALEKIDNTISIAEIIIKNLKNLEPLACIPIFIPPPEKIEIEKVTSKETKHEGRSSHPDDKELYCDDRLSIIEDDQKGKDEKGKEVKHLRFDDKELYCDDRLSLLDKEEEYKDRSELYVDKQLTEIEEEKLAK